MESLENFLEDFTEDASHSKPHLARKKSLRFELELFPRLEDLEDLLDLLAVSRKGLFMVALADKRLPDSSRICRVADTTKMAATGHFRVSQLTNWAPIQSLPLFSCRFSLPGTENGPGMSFTEVSSESATPSQLKLPLKSCRCILADFAVSLC